MEKAHEAVLDDVILVMHISADADLAKRCDIAEIPDAVKFLNAKVGAKTPELESGGECAKDQAKPQVLFVR